MPSISSLQRTIKTRITRESKSEEVEENKSSQANQHPKCVQLTGIYYCAANASLPPSLAHLFGPLAIAVRRGFYE